MEVPRDQVSQQYSIVRSALARVGSVSDLPQRNTIGSRKIEAWFLVPKGENADAFERLIVEAVRDHVYWRRNYHPGDPSHITESIKRSKEYSEALDTIHDGFRGILAFLNKSIPSFSIRYQGHMNWDLTIPGMLGYSAAMLYNPNNAVFEGSTANTYPKLLVGDDLCRMLGYRIGAPAELLSGAMRPWEHVTCDGSVANIEALWAARNLKFYPLALREAVASDPSLDAACGMRIALPNGGSRELVSLNSWTLLNLPPDEVLSVPMRLSNEFGIPLEILDKALAKYSLQHLGLAGFHQKFLVDVGYDACVLISGTKHYSLPKAVGLLGLGARNLIDVPVDLDARMDIKALPQELETCFAAKRPVIAVVAVIGSTEESAVDPLADVLKLQAKFAGRGLVFHVHADAAWGGYHCSLMNDDFDLPDPNVTLTTPQRPRAAPLSVYTQDQLRALGTEDSITVDPHKSGYMPYPAGALCYRNAAMSNLVTFSAPVVFHGEAEPTVGIYGIEGSKPGASAAAVYLRHRVIRRTRDGYSKIIGQALFSYRKLYARLLSMARPDDPFIIVPLPRTPSERTGKSDPDELKRIIELTDRQCGEQIRASEQAMALLREIGPDENILAYAFNLRSPDGLVNRDLACADALNRAIYSSLSIKAGNDVQGYDLLVSTTDLDEAAYGPAFMSHYKARLDLEDGQPGLVTVLRSVVMDPWVTETAAGSFIDVLEKEFRKAALAALGRLSSSHFAGGY